MALSDTRLRTLKAGNKAFSLKFPALLLLPCLFFQGLKRFWRNRLLSTPRVER